MTVLVTAARRDSTERRAFRTHMANLRMGELRPDTWLRPDNLPPLPDATPEGLGVAVVRGPLTGDDPAELVAMVASLAGRTGRTVA